MRLYHYQMAPNPRRVRIFLAEKGIEVEKVAVDLATGENRQPAYREKNPLGILPALELDDGTVICESMAICRYLEEVHPTPPLFGTTLLERARVEQWSRHAELELLFSVAHTFRNTNAFWVGRIEQVPAFGEVAQRTARERLGWFDQVLREREYLAGDSFSVADITLLCAIDFGKVADVRMTAEHTSLARWHALVKARPSAKA